MRRPAILFDFGNVIAHFDYAKACARLGEPHGLSGTELLARVKAAGLSDLVPRYESGRIGTSEFLESACAMTGLPIDPGQFADAWVDVFWINGPVAQIAR
ncbi:MAG: HAD family phosphatase, partial [Isosphaeraceae bacterium]